MNDSVSILSESIRRDLMVDQLKLVTHHEKNIPNSVSYDMRRYLKQPGWQNDDIGLLEYTYVGKKSQENALELKFCIGGQTYCTDSDCENDTSCKKTGSQFCADTVETIDVYSFKFTYGYLKQFVSTKSAISEAEKYLSFQHPETVKHLIPLCNKNRVILQSLFNHKYTDILENIFLNSQIQFLLVYSMDCLFGEGDRDKVYQCKFLEDERGRDTIVKAREILLQHIGDPITIKELARKVATNECYLKKGFKEMFGTTIFDFYQGQRMEHAKFLLYEKSLTVTDVSSLLGYSSISHFSTAFKKHTGLKPCELLVR